MWSGADASYLAAITAASINFTWHGTLTDANGTAYSFTAEDVVAGSGQITRTVSSPSSLDVGTVYTSQLNIKFFLSINRFILYGGTIELYCDVDVSGTTYSVPMGVYSISECTQELACIAITAYDAMTQFDDVTVKEDQGEVAPYVWISYLCGLAGVSLGSSQEDIEAMPNGTTALPFTYCDIKLNEMSCRDALGYLCQALCANAYIGRDGLLYIQQYGMTATDDIAANERLSSSLSDFTTNYTGISLNVYVTGTTYYYAESVDDGLTLELGANPWLQSGSADDRETACMAIIDSLTTVSYTPYTVSMPIRPELDPMDVLTFSGNQASSDIGAITSITYKMSGTMTVKCTGANPRLVNAKTKTEKSLAALTSTVAKEINKMSVVQNSAAVTIAEDTETSILSYAFEVTSETNTTMIDVSVALTASAVESESDDVYTLSDIVAALSFYVDDTEVSVYDPQFIIDEGKDTMTFNYSLSGLTTGGHEFDIRLTMDGGTGEIDAGDVHELLWGYGITFEVYAKSIEITSYPVQRVFVKGTDLDYTGVEVTLNYNNGLTEVVTSDCTFDPEDGTTTTEEEDLSVVATYETSEGTELTADFDMWVVDGSFANNVLYLGVGDGREYYEDLSSLEGYDFSEGTNLQYYQFDNSHMIKANQHDVVWQKTYYADMLGFRSAISTYWAAHSESYPVACEIMDGLVYLDKSDDELTYTFHHMSGDATKGVISDTADCSVTFTSTSTSMTLFGTNRSMYAIGRVYRSSGFSFGLYDAYNKTFEIFLTLSTTIVTDVRYTISDAGDVFFLIQYGYNKSSATYLYSIISGVKTLTNITSVLSWYRDNSQRPNSAIYYDETNGCLVVYYHDAYYSSSAWSFLTRGWKLNTDGSLIEELSLPDDVYIDGAGSHLYLNGSAMVQDGAYLLDSDGLPVSDDPVTSVALAFFDDDGIAYNHQGMLVKSGEARGDAGYWVNVYYYYYYYFDNLYFEESSGNIAFRGMCN